MFVSALLFVLFGLLFLFSSSLFLSELTESSDFFEIFKLFLEITEVSSSLSLFFSSIIPLESSFSFCLSFSLTLFEILLAVFPLLSDLAEELSIVLKIRSPTIPIIKIQITAIKIIFLFLAFD